MAQDISLAGAVADACFLAAEGIETVVARDEGIEDVDAAGSCPTAKGSPPAKLQLPYPDGSSARQAAAASAG